MRFKSLDVCLLVVISLSFCCAYQNGRGKFVSYNGNRYTEARGLDEGLNTTKAFFNQNRNRPPAHDTPASPCSCSKCP